MDQSFYDLLEVLTQLSGPAVYSTIVGILFACGLGLPIPEDITLITAGLLASSERISLGGAMLAGFLGVIVGDSILFFLGRRFGKNLFRIPGLRRVFTPERVASAETRIRKNGPFICFIARFLPGVRAAIFAMSGALGVRPMIFLLLDGLAALLSVPIWVYVGYWFGNNFEDAFSDALDAAKRMETYILAAVGLLIVGYVMIKVWQRRIERRRQLPQV